MRKVPVLAALIAACITSIAYPTWGRDAAGDQLKGLRGVIKEVCLLNAQPEEPVEEERTFQPGQPVEGVEEPEGPVEKRIVEVCILSSLPEEPVEQASAALPEEELP